MAPAHMLALASMLNGTPVGYRVREMMSLGGRGNQNLYYETPESSRTWLADIAEVDAGAGDPVRKSLYRFARIIIAHPFTDANGRFARAALQAGLARGGLIATPCLALAPIFYVHARDLRSALAGLSRTADWEAYFERMGDILSTCLFWVEKLSPPA